MKAIYQFLADITLFERLKVISCTSIGFLEPRFFWLADLILVAKETQCP